MLVARSPGCFKPQPTSAFACAGTSNSRDEKSACPNCCLFRPDAALEALGKFFGNFTERFVVVRALVPRDSTPVNGFGGSRRIGMMLNDVIIDGLGIRPALVLERDSSEAELHLREELVARKVPFNAVTLFTVAVEHNRRRRPRDVKAFKPGAVLFDVGFYGNKIVVNESGDLVVLI
jgi:hypothetical protein